MFGAIRINIGTNRILSDGIRIQSRADRILFGAIRIL